MRNAPLWSRSPESLFAELGSTPAGLSEREAAIRLAAAAPARLRARRSSARLRLLGSQFRTPITLLMIGGALISAFLGDYAEGGIILFIVAAGGGLGFWQEKRAADTLHGLMGRLQVPVRAKRGGRETRIPADHVVPGDVVLLEAGSAVPGDGLVLEARDLFADESALTGESFPAEKRPGPVPGESSPKDRSGAVFLGTHIVTGSATVLIAAVGDAAMFGAIAKGLAKAPPEHAFERGARRFGYLLLEISLALAVLIFALNVGLRRPVLDSLLFTLALAVGLTPQLLPAIQAVTLSRGAARMAGKEVIVRRLAAIEDIGGMNVLCTDKTGTLTRGEAELSAAEDPSGGESRKLRLYAYLNAALQSGYSNPIDAVLRARPPGGESAYAKTDEVPYDFSRKLLSVAATGPEGGLLITKGALDRVLRACALAEDGNGRVSPIAEARDAVAARAEALGLEGCRCLGVAYRGLGKETTAGVAEERDLVFLGLLAFSDPVKPDAAASLQGLRELGISVKMITGDNRVIAARVAGEVGLRPDRILTGSEMERLTLAGLARRVSRTEVFAEMDPGQKERIILALKRTGLAIGYMGDGINDASALHAADVGISVEGAADMTRQAADIVLLRKDLGVLAEGVREGRRAFANTLKYVFITSSANLGNMVSMAGISLFAAFLPMLPMQILLLNLLSDLPAMAIASDRLDPEAVRRPRHWDMRQIQRFMIVFGLISSAFDFLVFGALAWLGSSPEAFRTGWFLHSLLSELMILLIIRTRRRPYRSRPGRALAWLSALIAALAVFLPRIPGADRLGFAPLPWTAYAVLGVILVAYGLVSESAKRPFFARDPGGDAFTAKGRTKWRKAEERDRAGVRNARGSLTTGLARFLPFLLRRERTAP